MKQGLFFRPMFAGISPQNMARNMVQYLQFRILEFPLIHSSWKQVCTHCNHQQWQFFTNKNADINIMKLVGG